MGFREEPDDEVHVSSYVWRSHLWRKTRVQRFALYQQGLHPVASYVLAIVQMQRIWRGVLLRRRVLAKYLQKDFKRRWRMAEEVRTEEYKSINKPNDDQFLPCLRRLQARFRCCLLKNEYVRWTAYEKHAIYNMSCHVIQRGWKIHKHRKDCNRSNVRTKLVFVSKEDACASRIQDCWRAYINKQIYRFYVDLIKFRERGDPQLMLKCINPKEASLLDIAAGLHVRFRLGGTAFPPTIYYKIFCHSPVADLGAFAPKNYVTDKKHKTCAMTHNKIPVPQQDRSDWYKRVDYNYWRPISDHVLQDAEVIVEEAATGYKIPSSVPWHHSNLKRKDDIKRKVKTRRREWLVQLYTQEQLLHTGSSKKSVAKVRIINKSV